MSYAEELKAIIDEFGDAAANPKAWLDKYLAEGRKVILTAPVYTPEELIHAFGYVPMGAWGADVQLNEAKKYFPAFICSIVQSIVELGIKGAYDGASAIVIPSLCDSLKVIGQNWKVAVKNIPFIPMTYPQNRKSCGAAAFTRAGYERVISDIEKATGENFDESKLAASIEVYNKHNAVMRELADEMGKHPEISAADRSKVFKSATFMLKEEHTALAQKLLALLKANAPAGVKKSKIMTTGILADAPELLEIIDEYKLQIVADDVAAESRQYAYDAPAADNAMDSLIEKYLRMNNCSVLYDPEKARISYIIEKAKQSGAEGLLFVLTKFCDPEEFDYPMIKKACEAAELPIVMIEVDRQMENYGQARTAIETFADLL